eukprot:scaffold71979_cov59-Phaeocystis_antarctica.AAC.1
MASARPGAVRAPPGGLGHFLALTMSKGARPHAHMAAYSPRWPPGTGSRSRRDLDSEEESSSLRDRVGVNYPPTTVAS